MKDKKKNNHKSEDSHDQKVENKNDQGDQGKQEKQEKQENSVNFIEEIERLKKQVEENLAGWKRARADYDNLKKDIAKERAEFINFANVNLLMELLPIMDNFRAAFNSVPENDKKSAWVVGLGHIKKQFEDFLKNNGVEQIKTVGEKFDPELHEAVGREKIENQEADVIIKEVKAGYKLHGKVIQAAKVVVNEK